jgi:RNA-directed DNA polymerase
MTDKSGITKLDRIGLCAAKHPSTKFNNLGHVISEDLLRKAYRELDGKKAVGIDGVTKEAYGKKLDENISNLIQRIRRKQYKPKASRIVEIPKEDGSTRPLAISCFEDKLIQWVVSKILERIYEPLFLSSSYGFRPERSCHDALKALSQVAYKFNDGAIVEMDIRKCYNMIPHDPLMACLRHKVVDSRFLWLVETLITAPIMENDEPVDSKRGCPQGSIVSPILSNIYLHFVIDVWFATIQRTHMKGKCEQIRYADDMVFLFECASDATRFYASLGKRLNKYGLQLHEDKTGIWPSGKKAAQRASQCGRKMPTYMFLGFTCYWGKARKGFWRLKFKSRRDRFAAKLKGLRVFLRENRNVGNTDKFLERVIKGIEGWINYHAISDNQRKVHAFLHESRKHIFKWFNHRGCSQAINWEGFNLRLKSVGFPTTFRTKSMFAKAN